MGTRREAKLGAVVVRTLSFCHATTVPPRESIVRKRARSRNERFPLIAITFIPDHTIDQSADMASQRSLILINAQARRLWRYLFAIGR